jgi:hypothetical protein
MRYTSAAKQIFDRAIIDGGRKTNDECSPSSVFRLPSNPDQMYDRLYYASRILGLAQQIAQLKQPKAQAGLDRTKRLAQPLSDLDACEIAIVG